MTPYILSICVGVLVGAIYSLLSVRSPAPPVIALVGLLGILVGEQLPPLLRSVWRGEIADVEQQGSLHARLFDTRPTDRSSQTDVVERPGADSF